MRFFKLCIQAENLLFLLEDPTEYEIRFSESFLYHKNLDLRFYHPIPFSIYYNDEEITKFFSWYELYKIKKKVRAITKIALAKFQPNKLNKEWKSFLKLGE